MLTTIQKDTLKRAGYLVYHTESGWGWEFPSNAKVFDNLKSEDEAWDAAWQYILGGPEQPRLSFDEKIKVMIQRGFSLGVQNVPTGGAGRRLVYQVQHQGQKALEGAFKTDEAAWKAAVAYFWGKTGEQVESYKALLKAPEPKKQPFLGIKNVPDEPTAQSKTDALLAAGYTVERVPSTLGYGVFFEGKRYNAKVFNTSYETWEWMHSYLPKDGSRSRISVMANRGFTLHVNVRGVGASSTAEYRIRHQGDEMSLRSFSTEDAAWSNAILNFWDMTDEQVERFKDDVKLAVKMRENDISIDLENAEKMLGAGFKAGNVYKALSSILSWVQPSKKLSRVELAERKIYIMYNKDTGHRHWSDLGLGIESCRAWETEEEAVDAANEWLFNHHVINRSDLK